MDEEIFEKFGAEKTSAFRAKLLEVSNDLGIDPNYIMVCIALETGKTFDSSAKKPKSSATGLIQFMKDTALDLGTTVGKLSSMDHVEQMGYIEKYFLMTARDVGVPTDKWSLEDVYFSILTPSIIKKNDNDVVYHKGQKTYSDNLFHDRNKDGLITKKISEDIRIFMRK